MEKLKGFISSEKLRGFVSRVFTKKRIRIAIALIALLVVLRVGFMVGFQVRGTVLKVDTSSITVTNFLGTRTVNLGDYPLDSSRVTAGEKVTITKNLSGDVIAVRVNGDRHGRYNAGPGRNGKFGQPSAGQGQSGQFRQGKNGQGFQRPNGRE